MLTTCPTSYISAESITLLEEFNVWRQLGCTDRNELTGRQVDAFTTLAKEYATEIRDAQQHARNPR